MHDIIPKVKKGKSRKIAAGKMKVGENKIQKAKKIKEVAKKEPTRKSTDQGGVIRAVYGMVGP